MRADAHLEVARLHAERASLLASLSDARGDRRAFSDPQTGLWYRAWETGKEEERLAEVHRSAAATLQAEYEERCKGFTEAETVVSPLQRFRAGEIPTSDGVIVLLGAEAGPPDRLLAMMRCHSAWMMLGGAATDRSALDLPGIDFVAYGDRTGVSLEISVREPALVTELQRRVGRELEKAVR